MAPVGSRSDAVCLVLSRGSSAVSLFGQPQALCTKHIAAGALNLLRLPPVLPATVHTRPHHTRQRKKAPKISHAC
ncbi:hypothetical protein K461DRAFT_280764 [Myriangium duriaei CBS 260.36]|uniref:Uncharacterized protein n=1 Tax=Myriangium duriaei CBS 260.36 TaxID=1168546 RepID=A0A9P4IZM9_9PEZI|nr:hypothetical protein K461DRAFT_280764 [Myriangium duriaei CBS 260.36]